MRIDGNTLLRMSDGEKAEFAIWTEFLEGDGYQLLRQFLEGQSESAHHIIQNPANWDEHVYARGTRDALNFVLNLESILEARIAEIEVALETEEIEESLVL
jgi:hypothetical protein